MPQLYTDRPAISEPTNATFVEMEPHLHELSAEELIVAHKPKIAYACFAVAGLLVILLALYLSQHKRKHTTLEKIDAIHLKPKND